MTRAVSGCSGRASHRANAILRPVFPAPLHELHGLESRQGREPLRAQRGGQEIGLGGEPVDPSPATTRLASYLRKSGVLDALLRRLEVDWRNLERARRYLAGGAEAAQLMLERGSGSILFTGASASVKGYPNSSSFAMGKFGLRGLAQLQQEEKRRRRR